MDGGSLADFLKTVKTIPEDHLAAICKQASDMWQKLAIFSWVKSNLHPPTCSKVRISTSNFKTGQLWPSNSRKSLTFNLLGGFAGEQ